MHKYIRGGGAERDCGVRAWLEKEKGAYHQTRHYDHIDYATSKLRFHGEVKAGTNECDIVVNYIPVPNNGASV